MGKLLGSQDGEDFLYSTKWGAKHKDKVGKVLARGCTGESLVQTLWGKLLPDKMGRQQFCPNGEMGCRTRWGIINILLDKMGNN